jgi:hypothetical protein
MRARTLFDKIHETYRDEYKINEGLIYTHPLSSVFNILGKKFEIFVDKKTNIFYVRLLNEKINKENFQNLLITANNLGWFCAGFTTDLFGTLKFDENEILKLLEKNSIRSLELLFNAKFDVMIDKVPEFLYHLTTTNKIEKIFKRGLSPKTYSKNSSHPERIYFLIDKDYAKSLAVQFYEKTGNLNYTLLKINCFYVKPYIRLFNDSMFTADNGKIIAYYTLNNIPPHAIEVEKEINI